MAFDFPNNPTVGQRFAPVAGGREWQWNGAAWVSSGGSALGMQITEYVFLSSSTYTPGNGMLYCEATCWGGGGGAAGAPATGTAQMSAGGPGNGGAKSYALLTAGQIGAGQSVTIGSGGTGGTGAAGNAGSVTTFGGFVSARGGEAGAITAVTASTAGVITAAQPVSQSALGDVRGWTCAAMHSAMTQGFVTSLGISGQNELGGGQPGNSGIGQSNAPANTGAGGGATINGSSAGTRLGGAGGSGLCIVREYSGFTGSAPAPGTMIRRMVTASGTWNRPNGCIAIEVEVQGAGGGGGNFNGSAAGTASAGGGGGAGGWAKKLISTPPASATLTVGAFAGSGATGGTTSYSDGANALQGNGGAGGGPSPAAATAYTNDGLRGAGGGAAGGDTNVTGAWGGRVLVFVQGNTAAFAGDGANSRYGLGGMGRGNAGTGAYNIAGVAGTGYGAGGGGGVALNGNAGSSGGNSAPGLIIITEFY